VSSGVRSSRSSRPGDRKITRRKRPLRLNRTLT
jgi:hypothetical protein